MEREKINKSIGDLATRDKYKFLPTGLVDEICQDFVEFYSKLKEMEEANK